MWDMVPPKILVAVEDVGADAALVYAAQDAARRGCGMHLVHVAGPALRAACAYDDVVLLEDELRHAGEAVLASAVRRAEHLLHEVAPDDDRLSVSSELVHGSVVASLDALSPHACLAVLQHQGMGASGETATLSVTAGVAAGARCPVAAVPDRWQPRPTPLGVVTVGVDVARPSRFVVEAALHEADRRGATLQVVHAWQPDGHAADYDTVVAAVRDGLHELVAEAGSDHTVPVEVLVEHGPPAAVLREQSDACDLLVLGRHHRRHVIGARLGATCREVLRWSPTPVLVVDPLRSDGPATDRRASLTTALP